MIFSNTLVGIAIMFTRFVLWLSLGVFCLGRIDLTLLPGPGQLEYLDLGYRAYIAVVRQDHRYNHPVSVVFFDLLTEQIAATRRKRARRMLRRHFRLTCDDGIDDWRVVGWLAGYELADGGHLHVTRHLTLPHALCMRHAACMRAALSSAQLAAWRRTCRSPREDPAPPGGPGRTAQERE